MPLVQVALRDVVRVVAVRDRLVAARGVVVAPAVRRRACRRVCVANREHVFVGVPAVRRATSGAPRPLCAPAPGAASRLGVKRSTLRDRMRKFGIDAREVRTDFRYSQGAVKTI
jgi:hypothetical protein